MQHVKLLATQLYAARETTALYSALQHFHDTVVTHATMC